jgi:branched-chain amino acid transport system permease protein
MAQPPLRVTRRMPIPRGREWQAAGTVALVLALLLPLVLRQSSQAQIWLDTIAYAEVFAILALGLNVVVGFAGLLDLGYAAFYAIGAYTFGLLASAQSQFWLPAGTSLNLPFLTIASSGVHQGIHLTFWVALPLCGLVAATFGVILGAPTLRLRGDYLAIVTLGFGEIVPEVITNLGPNNPLGWPNITNGTNSIFGIDQPHIGGLQFSTDQLPWYYLGLATLVVIIWLASRLENSRLGRAWIAMREDELAAACMGINLTRTKLAAFAMGAFFAGIAGMINGSRLQTITPDSFKFEVSITILTMVVLGGMGSIPGVLIGAIIIAALQLTLLDQLTNFLQYIGGVVHSSFLQSVDLTQGKNLIFGLLLVLMMIFRREGLFPSRRRSIELHPTTMQEQAEENIQLAGLREEA